MTELLERIPTLVAIYAWLLRKFGRKPIPLQPPQLDIPQHNVEVVDVPIPDASIRQGKKSNVIRFYKPGRTATQVRPDTETFSDLLDGLDDSFKTMNIPEIKGNWLPKKDIRALHKLGIFIPTPMSIESQDHPTLTKGMMLPSIASALFVSKKHETLKNRCYPRFTFAIKQPRLPDGVEQIKGTPYQFGYCVELTEFEHDKNSPPRMFWIWAWVVVRADGSIYLPKELRAISNVIRHKRRTALEKGLRKDSFISRQWTVPTAFVKDESSDSELDQGGYEAFLLSVFRQLMVWWSQRPEQWSVGVSRDGKRATFMIQQEHTSAYFADRDKLVTVNGLTKKIVHFVREHTRVSGSVVRAHVRGLTNFDWRGYQCSVVAPKFRGAVTTVLSLNPIEIDEKDLSENYMDIESVAQMLADSEDAPRFNKVAA